MMKICHIKIQGIFRCRKEDSVDYQTLRCICNEFKHIFYFLYFGFGVTIINIILLLKFHMQTKKIKHVL